MKNEIPQGMLVECPECAMRGVKQILGRVLTNGDFMVLRFHHGTTIIRTSQYELVCGCGYVFNIAGTVVASAPSEDTYSPVA
jgi:hypothetical protein